MGHKRTLMNIFLKFYNKIDVKNTVSEKNKQIIVIKLHII
ncbi:hypothetical protein MUS1_14605 [Marinomonas ushuaiensis DSM 15871]|uniref:Uncharacterized protein n=1 Tax=Marinomonas ushuaiensis DSM 15871 TaxID=1122207 RepID=X7E3C0_9GAMM|nr:hypothetical protein MUS1_14605 [Marinomonas ushuaiensis DSM 15871]